MRLLKAFQMFTLRLIRIHTLLRGQVHWRRSESSHDQAGRVVPDVQGVFVQVHNWT